MGDVSRSFPSTTTNSVPKSSNLFDRQSVRVQMSTGVRVSFFLRVCASGQKEKSSTRKDRDMGNCKVPVSSSLSSVFGVVRPLESKGEERRMGGDSNGRVQKWKVSRKGMRELVVIFLRSEIEIAKDGIPGDGQDAEVDRWYSAHLQIQFGFARRLPAH